MPAPQNARKYCALTGLQSNIREKLEPKLKASSKHPCAAFSQFCTLVTRQAVCHSCHLNFATRTEKKNTSYTHSNNPSSRSNKRKGRTLARTPGSASMAFSLFLFSRHHLLLSLFVFSLSNQSSLLSPRHCSPSCNTPMGEGEKCCVFLVEFHGVFL